MTSQHSRLRTYPDLLTWRKAQGLTQIDAAKRFTITQAHYSKLETGRAVPRKDLLERIARETRVPLEALVGVSL